MMAGRTSAATLNPASVPFFPSGIAISPLDVADQQQLLNGGGTGIGFSSSAASHEQEPSFMSSTSAASTEYRSANSSPARGSAPSSASVTSGGGDNGSVRAESRQSLLPIAVANMPAVGEEKGNVGGFPPAERSREDEINIVGKPTNILDGEETPGPREIHRWVLGAQAPGRNDTSNEAAEITTAMNSIFQEHHLIHHGPPTRTFTNSTTHSFNLPFKSTSPVSSIGSASINTSSIDFSSVSFEAQLKASPTIRDLLDRLTRCEQSNREIQHQLSEVHSKVSLLVERSIGSLSQEPEFKNPFAPVSSASRSLTPSAGLGPNILQTNSPLSSSPVKADEISQLSHRINTLTTSVGQLLALQTQQHMNTVAQSFSQAPGQVTPQQPLEIAPNQIVPQAPPVSSTALLGHGLPNRPDLRPNARTPNPPMRTWSAGTLDLPMRPTDNGLGRPDGVLRDKRRSVAGLMRRDSAGIPDSPSEHWSNGSSREPGPVASKWEHLPLAPELLRSLSKFGVGPPNKIQQRALPFLLRGSDIIAQAPPTQERIAAYVIPAIHVAVLSATQRPINRGPIVVMISTTVDQATQAQRMIRDLGGPINVRSALGVGSTGPNGDISQELRLLQQNMPHILCGTPQKLHALFTTPGGLSGAEVRLLVLDEVDQLIARNLHEYVFNIVKLLPPPKSRAAGPNVSAPGGGPGAVGQPPFGTPIDATVPGPNSPFGPNGRRFSAVSTSSTVSGEPLVPTPTPPQIERQTALFSNTVPQDVLNLANAIQLREPVRVLVRRDGNVTHSDANQGTKGLRQFYLYLAFTAGGGRSDVSTLSAGGGLGIIGSGRGAASSAETAQAREWKLEALADLLDDVDVPQIIVHVGGMTALDAVVYKLASRSLEAIPLHSDMNAGAKLAALNKFRGSTGSMLRQPVTKVLVIYDVQVKAPDVFQVPLVINYDLPQAVEEYAHRVAPAIANNYSRAGVVVNFVTATGGDVEMLRSIECFYKIKCPEVPMSLRDVL